jgi:hypothetical protein
VEPTAGWMLSIIRVLRRRIASEIVTGGQLDPQFPGVYVPGEGNPTDITLSICDQYRGHARTLVLIDGHPVLFGNTKKAKDLRTFLYRSS